MLYMQGGRCDSGWDASWNYFDYPLISSFIQVNNQLLLTDTRVIQGQNHGSQRDPIHICVVHEQYNEQCHVKPSQQLLLTAGSSRLPALIGDRRCHGHHVHQVLLASRQHLAHTYIYIYITTTSILSCHRESPNKKQHSKLASQNQPAATTCFVREPSRSIHTIDYPS